MAIANKYIDTLTNICVIDVDSFIRLIIIFSDDKDLLVVGHNHNINTKEYQLNQNLDLFSTLYSYVRACEHLEFLKIPSV